MLARSRLRLLFALMAVLTLATGTAVAQERDRDEPAAEETGEDVEGSDDAGDDEAEKKNSKNDDEFEVEAECEPEERDPESGPGEAGDEGEDLEPVPDPEPECEPPPRCEGEEIDLAPEEDEPNCVDQRRLNRLIAEFEAAAAEEAVALAELSAALDSLTLLNEQLAALQVRLGEVQLRLASARADAGFAALREVIAAESLDDVSAALAAEEDHLRAQAVQAYIGGDDVELATSAALLELDNYADVETAREYASAVIDDQLVTIDRVDALRNAVLTLTEVVAAIEQAAEADEAKVVAIEEQVDVLIGEQRGLVAEAEAEAERIAERIADIQDRKQAYAEELRITGAGGGAIGEMLRNRQVDQEPPEDPYQLLAMPLQRTRLGSPFGPRVHPIFTDTRLHTGIDMSGSSGDQILASADGIVVYAEETSGYGNVVVVDHGNTIATLYAHLTADAVWVGQEVVTGDLLGFVGSTGYSTGPHLHFEVRISGQPVDPMPYLDFG